MATWIPVPKVYRALMTQSGTNAPTAVVLENTLGGTVVWGYEELGYYTAIISGGFDRDATSVILGAPEAGVLITPVVTAGGNVEVSVVQISGMTSTNDALARTPIEILVYP